MAINEQELYGPRTQFSRWIHADRHRGPEETYDDYAVRYCRAVARDNNRAFYRTLHHLRHQSILPAGRQQVSVGRPYATTAMNCFVSRTIDDSLTGIFEALREAAITMGAGGGIGFDFSTIRPQGDRVAGLGGMGSAAGPCEFMRPFSEMCKVLIRSWARGAMMGVLRIDHPDVIRFVNAKRNLHALNAFNLSLWVTNAFMEALTTDGLVDLQFMGRKMGQARAWDIWGPVIESNWDNAEPGIIFGDRYNKLNPLWYTETISATNPCSEQGLPPWGCCLLGSYNMVKFLVPQPQPVLIQQGPLHEVPRVRYDLDYELLGEAIEMMVRAFDNVIDRTVYPLPQQQAEEKAKRRMGIGPAGMADALAIMGFTYGTPQYIEMQNKVLQFVTNKAFKVSSQLAREKGKFPLFAVEKYCEGDFFKRLDDDVQWDIVKYGLRNSHLTSIAPTGTISLDADNISGGIEPAFALRQSRKVDTVREGIKEFELINYAYNFYGVEGRTAEQVTPEEHVKVLCGAQYWIDSSISKTINIKGQVSGEGPGTTFEEFENVYMQVWEQGGKCCSTFNSSGSRMGILTSQDQPREDPALACTINPETGERSCEA